MSDLRVTVTRKTNDDYRWALSEKQGDGWKELAALEYLRVARLVTGTRDYFPDDSASISL